MTSQGTSEFQEIHLDWQYPDPRSPQSGYKRLFNVQGHQNFEGATYPGAYQLDSIYKNLQSTYNFIRNISDASDSLILSNFLPVDSR